ncbi:tetratricopeptide repeat protein [Azospirillum soli]|uniref:tetratricopeptide repeat protein n=1 Tax=Azospirillum soli TaxID=1304799 RepID=UPI001FEC217C|nr:tetratricopeptide repeat protein [Azospirillum soli]MBP2316464.1 Flp pilus assembly protein TadD [Azospirillum soli]
MTKQDRNKAPAHHDMAHHDAAHRAFAEAVARHHAGDLAGAERGYRAILQADPGHVEALHLLGVLAHQTGHDAEAARLIAEAIARANEKGGGKAEHHANLGLALHGLGRVAEAEAAYRRALALKEDYPEAQNSLGSALQDLGRLDEAIAHYRRALELRGAYPEALVNLGTALHAQDRLEEAEASLRAALALDPADPLAHTDLGVVLKEAGRLDEAEAAHTEALRLAPGDPETLVNLGLLREAQGRPVEAEACYREALRSDPGFALARWNLSLLLIGRGALPEGRDLYEARFDSRRVLGARSFPVPRWQGEDLSGKRIMVWREQGLGDELLYATCLPDLIRRAGQVILECDPRMVGLFARSFPQATVRAQTFTPDGRETVDPPDFDTHVPMASLTRFLRRDYASFSAAGAYLVPDPERAALWRDRLAALPPGVRVGVCWRSQRTLGERKHAYTHLDAWAPLFRVPGLVFVALQYDARDEEIDGALERQGVTLHRWADTDLKNDLEAAAALTAGLDLVVTVASSVGEMAGALGVPVWRFGGANDWTMQGTAVRPWFPSMRMWRARGGEGLDGVLARMAGALKQQLPTVIPAKAGIQGNAGKSQMALDPRLRGDDDLLKEAHSLHQSGQWPEAEKAYQSILQADANHAEALEGYGWLGHQAGRPDIAVELIGRAIAAGGGTAERHRRRALAFQTLGAFAEAEADYRAALTFQADDAEALGNLGVVLLGLGNATEAADVTAKAARLQPLWAGLHANLGLALQAVGSDGDGALRRALALDPALAEAWNGLASSALAADRVAQADAFADRALRLRPDYPEALSNQGVALLALNKNPEAVAALRAALRLRPDDARTLGNLAHALEAAGEADRAALAWWKIILLDPGSSEGFAGLADLRQRQKRFDAALRAWGRALTLNSQRAEWHYNLGNAFQAAGRPSDADVAYRRAVEVDPSLSLATFNRGYAALARGELELGWTGLEARFASGQATPDRRFRKPLWDGGDLTGKTVLLWREQGVGDELLYASCYADLIARASRVIVECDPRLVPLMARSFPNAVVRAETADPDDFDLHVPAGSLPRHFRTRLDAFPDRAGWLTPDPEKLNRWRDRLAALGPGLKIGICWRSRFRNALRESAYTILDQWGPILATPGVHFVNLQYDDCVAELATAEERFGVRVRRWPDVDLMNDLDEAAALTAALDLVISAGTSVAEMAGALGVPVWRFGWAGEWTALGTAVRPWYPSMRLFAPPPGGTLDDALGAIGRAVTQAITRPGRSRP